jgi:hypothetical protein
MQPAADSWQRQGALGGKGGVEGEVEGGGASVRGQLGAA